MTILPRSISSKIRLSDSNILGISPMCFNKIRFSPYYTATRQYLLTRDWQLPQFLPQGHPDARTLEGLRRSAPRCYPQGPALLLRWLEQTGRGRMPGHHYGDESSG